MAAHSSQSQSTPESSWSARTSLKTHSRYPASFRWTICTFPSSETNPLSLILEPASSFSLAPTTLFTFGKEVMSHQETYLSTWQKHRGILKFYNRMKEPESKSRLWSKALRTNNSGACSLEISQDHLLLNCTAM